GSGRVASSCGDGTSCARTSCAPSESVVTIHPITVRSRTDRRLIQAPLCRRCGSRPGGYGSRRHASYGASGPSVQRASRLSRRSTKGGHPAPARRHCEIRSGLVRRPLDGATAQAGSSRRAEAFPHREQTSVATGGERRLLRWDRLLVEEDLV